MITSFFKLFKIPILISITIGIILVGSSLENRFLQIFLIMAGALVGALILDLDYYIHAYFTEPNSDFSQNLKTYVAHKDFKGSLEYVHHQKESVKEKTLNSGMFQLALIAMLFLVFFSQTNIFVKSMLLAVYANSIYKFAENYYLHKSFEDWFWFLKGTPSKGWVGVYVTFLIAILLYFIYYF